MLDDDPKSWWQGRTLPAKGVDMHSFMAIICGVLPWGSQFPSSTTNVTWYVDTNARCDKNVIFMLNALYGANAMCDINLCLYGFLVKMLSAFV